MNLNIKDFTTKFHDNSKEALAVRQTYADANYEVEMPKYMQIAEALNVSVEELQYRVLRFASSHLLSQISNHPLTDDAPEELAFSPRERDSRWTNN